MLACRNHNTAKVVFNRYYNNKYYKYKIHKGQVLNFAQNSRPDLCVFFIFKHTVTAPLLCPCRASDDGQYGL
jgi:hypothetical protein